MPEFLINVKLFHSSNLHRVFYVHFLYILNVKCYVQYLESEIFFYYIMRLSLAVGRFENLSFRFLNKIKRHNLRHPSVVYLVIWNYENKFPRENFSLGQLCWGEMCEIIQKFWAVYEVHKTLLKKKQCSSIVCQHAKIARINGC